MDVAAEEVSTGGGGSRKGVSPGGRPGHYIPLEYSLVGTLIGINGEVMGDAVIFIIEIDSNLRPGLHRNRILIKSQILSREIYGRGCAGGCGSG